MEHRNKYLIVKSIIVLVLICILACLIATWHGDCSNNISPQQYPTTVNTFEYHIRLEEDVPKQIKNEVSRLAIFDWRVIDITIIPNYTEAIVYDEKGDISHTIQWVLGYDVFIIANKEICYEPSQTL
jgi:hypothetical protein